MMHGYTHFYHDPKFWVAVSFVLFFLLLGKKLWGAISSALDGRAAGIRRQLEEASRLRAEAEQMLKDAEAERAAAAREAESLLVNARAEAERLATSAAAEAEASAKRRERMALDRIAAAEASAIADVRNAAAEIAGAAARTVLAETLDATADAALVDKSLIDLPKALRAA
jgi:F-type H+-transporting ATPase subunit b